MRNCLFFVSRINVELESCLLANAAFIWIFALDFVFSGIPLPSLKIECIYSTIWSKRPQMLVFCLLKKISEMCIHLHALCKNKQNEPYTTISDHNKTNFREKNAGLLCNRSSRQRDFNSYRHFTVFRVRIVLIVHVSHLLFKLTVTEYSIFSPLSLTCPLSFFFSFFFFLRSPLYLWGSPLLGEIFAYVTDSVFVDDACWVCFCCRHSPV